MAKNIRMGLDGIINVERFSDDESSDDGDAHENRRAPNQEKINRKQQVQRQPPAQGHRNGPRTKRSHDGKFEDKDGRREAALPGKQGKSQKEVLSQGKRKMQRSGPRTKAAQHVYFKDASAQDDSTDSDTPIVRRGKNVVSKPGSISAKQKQPKNTSKRGMVTRQEPIEPARKVRKQAKMKEVPEESSEDAPVTPGRGKRKKVGGSLRPSKHLRF